MLPLNNQAEPGATTDLYRSRLRDRLAGLCRRLIVTLHGHAARHRRWPTRAARRPTSAFWDPLFELRRAAHVPPASSPPPTPPADAQPPEPPELPDLPSTTWPQGLDLLLGLLDGGQLGALGDIDAALIDALPRLTPAAAAGPRRS